MPEPRESPVADTVAGERSIASVNEARSLQSRVSNLLAMGLMSTLGLRVPRLVLRPHLCASGRGEARRAGGLAQPGGGRDGAAVLRAHRPAGAGGRSGLRSAARRCLRRLRKSQFRPGRSDTCRCRARCRQRHLRRSLPPELALERRLAGPVSEGPEVAQEASSSSLPRPKRVHPGRRSHRRPPRRRRAIPWPRSLGPVPRPPSQARVLPAAAAAAAQRGLHRLHARDRDRLDAPRHDHLHHGDRHLRGRWQHRPHRARQQAGRRDPRRGAAKARRGCSCSGPRRARRRAWSCRSPPPAPMSSAARGSRGRCNRHFFQRFGAAILISVIDGAVQGAVAQQSRGGTVIYNPSGVAGCHDGGAEGHGQHPADHHQGAGRSDPGPGRPRSRFQVCL